MTNKERLNEMVYNIKQELERLEEKSKSSKRYCGLGRNKNAK